MAEQYAYDLKRLARLRDPHSKSGRRRIESLTRDSVDCVILDLKCRDGRVRVLRSSSGWDCASVIVYTGTATTIAARAFPGAYTHRQGEPMERVRAGSGECDRTAPATDEVTLRPRFGLESPLSARVPRSRAQGRDRPRGTGAVPHSSVGESGTGKELVLANSSLGPNPKGHSSRSTAGRPARARRERAVRPRTGRVHWPPTPLARARSRRPAGNAIPGEIGDFRPRAGQAAARARGAESHPPRRKQDDRRRTPSWPRRTAISRRKSRGAVPRGLFYG